MMTSTIRKFGVGVASLAMVAGMAAPAIAFDPSPFYNVNKLRVAGADRVATSIAFAKGAFKDMREFGGKTGDRVAYLAGFDNPADSAAAGSLGAPIFLVKADGSSNKDVAAAIAGMNISQVVALGGEKAVPADVLSKIAAEAGAIPTARLEGKDRYQTSVAIAERWSANNGQFTPEKVVLANGITLVDALTAGTLGWPVLLTDEQGKLPESVVNYLNQVKPLDYIAVGGQKVIPEQTVKNAQATSLNTDNLSTDDSLPELRTKSDRWTNEIARTYRPEAAKAAGLAQTAKLQADAQTNAVDSAVSALSSAITNAIALNLGQSSPVQLPGDGKSWPDYLASPAASSAIGKDDVIAKRDALRDAIRAAYKQPTFELDLDTIKKFLKVNRNGVTLMRDELNKAFVNDAVEGANKVVVKYYRTNPKDTSILAADPLARQVMGEDKVLTSEITDYNVYQIKGVIDKIAELTAGTLSSAESTLRALNLKIAGVQDQVAGKSYWRLAGKDRYGTAAAISARKANLSFSAKDGEGKAGKIGKIYLVNGSAFADATVAGASSAPILLIGPDGVMVPEVTTKEIIRVAKDYRNKRYTTTEVWAVGGKKVVTDQALAATNATAVIAQREEDNSTPVAQDTITVTNPTFAIKVNDGTGVNNKIMVNGFEVNPGSKQADHFTINGASATSLNGVKVEWDTDKIKVTTDNTATKGTYVIGFTFDGKKSSFTVNVADPVSAPTFGSAQPANDIPTDESEVKLVQITNWNTLKDEGVTGLDSFGPATKVVDGTSAGTSVATNVILTKIDSDGWVWGKVKSAFGAGKQFKIKLQANATSTHPQATAETESPEITVHS